LRRVPEIIAAILAWTWVFAAAFPGIAHSAGEGAAPGAAGSSFLQAWLRHSATAGRELAGLPDDGGRTGRELDRLAGRLRPAVEAAKGGPAAVDAFRRVLLEEEGFRYDAAAGNVENFLAGAVLSRKRGNCLGLSMLWLSLAERFGVPFRGAYVPGHCFVRYEGEDARVNVEFSAGGAPWEDGRYIERFRLAEGGPYLRALTSAEMLGVFLKSVGAAYAGKGRHAEALSVYAEAERLYPGLPDVHYNAGVSLQRLGRSDEAIAKYRKALSLDPGMAPARGNLASTYAACGNYEEGIREYRTAVELDPSSAKAREGLTRAWFARGDYPEAAREAERAEALGCRFEPSMLDALEPYRERRAPSDSP
jgi:tetratricopeptide (TPR) repeat protein